MYVLYLRVFNRYGECEHEKHFHAKTKAAVSMLAGRYCIQCWGHSGKDELTIKRRVNQYDDHIIYWDIT